MDNNSFYNLLLMWGISIEVCFAFYDVFLCIHDLPVFWRILCSQRTDIYSPCNLQQCDLDKVLCFAHLLDIPNHNESSNFDCMNVVSLILLF